MGYMHLLFFLGCLIAIWSCDSKDSATGPVNGAAKSFGVVMLMNGDLYGSRDSGSSFESIGSGPSFVRTLFAADGVLYAQEDKTTLWISDDSARSWKSRTIDITSSRLVPPLYARNGTLLLGGTNRLYRSIDTAASFAETTIGPYPGDDVTVVYATAGTIWCALTISSLWRSLDNGLTFTEEKSGIAETAPRASAFADKGGTTLCVIKGNLYRSTTNGDTWTKITAGLPSDAETGGLYQVDSTFYLSLSKGLIPQSRGLYKSSDGSAWSGVCQDSALVVNAVAGLGNRLFIAAVDGLFISDDNGVTCRRVTEQAFIDAGSIQFNILSVDGLVVL